MAGGGHGSLLQGLERGLGAYLARPLHRAPCPSYRRNGPRKQRWQLRVDGELGATVVGCRRCPLDRSRPVENNRGDYERGCRRRRL